MNCQRLTKLIKTWYLQVHSETMAPARMVSFMNQHIAECEECLADPMVKDEIEKIRAIVLPASKVPKEDDETEDEIDDSESEGDDIIYADDETEESDDAEEDDEEEIDEYDDDEDDEV